MVGPGYRPSYVWVFVGSPAMDTRALRATSVVLSTPDTLLRTGGSSSAFGSGPPTVPSTARFGATSTASGAPMPATPTRTPVQVSVPAVAASTAQASDS